MNYVFYTGDIQSAGSKIKTIQDELGGGGQEQEIEEMRQKAERMRWNLEVRDTFMKELAKLERTHPQSPDYSVQLNYLQTMLDRKSVV